MISQFPAAVLSGDLLSGRHLNSFSKKSSAFNINTNGNLFQYNIYSFQNEVTGEMNVFQMRVVLYFFIIINSINETMIHVNLYRLLQVLMIYGKLWKPFIKMMLIVIYKIIQTQITILIIPLIFIEDSILFFLLTQMILINMKYPWIYFA